ncbi:NAD(P)-dependent oxidoreductase [Emcibacter nanhaiensis]|nr:NAD(P)-dependent oxidoreductase [Emcibacter nanhaiensis]
MNNTFPNTAFLGMGAMGSRMAMRLLDAGVPLTLWNRTGSRAEPLVSRGAKLASSPSDAAKNAEIIFVMVEGDEASQAIWSGPNGLVKGLRPQSIAIECSTLSLKRITQLDQEAKQNGWRFIEAPVSGSLPHAEGGNLTFLLGGAPADIADASTLIEVMGTTHHHVGAPPNATLVKLAINGLLATQVCSMAEVLGFLSRCGMPPGEVERFFEATPVLSPIVAATLRQVSAKDFKSLYPISLVLKDLRYLFSASDEVGADLPLVFATHSVFKSQEEQRTQNISAVANNYLQLSD